VCISGMIWFLPVTSINSTRSIKMLVWNVRGINSQQKWDAIWDKIGESSTNIVCLQETKRSLFDSSYRCNFCLRILSNFEFAASDGTSVVWTSLGPLHQWVPGPTTRWAPGTT
jgi:hypothetical protein